MSAHAPTPSAILDVFDAAIASATSPEQADDRRLLKAYFTDPAFRSAMAEICWEATQRAEAGAGKEASR